MRPAARQYSLFDIGSTWHASAEAEVFARRLYNLADNEFRFDGHPAVLRALLYREQLGKVSEADVARWLKACVRAGVVAVEQVNGQPQVQVLLDLGRQRPAARRRRAAAALAPRSRDSGASPRRFFVAWKRGRAGVPYCACRARDFYAAFLAWCSATAAAEPATQTTFGIAIGAELVKVEGTKTVRRFVGWPDAAMERGQFKGDTIRMQGLLIEVPTATSRGRETEDASAQVQRFQRALHALQVKAAGLTK